MILKFLLRRNRFCIANLVYILGTLCVGMHSLFLGKHNIIFRGLTAGWCIIVAVCMYICCFYKITISNMMYAMYLMIINIGTLLLIVFLRFLFEFNASDPLAVPFDNIPIAVICFFSLANMLYITSIRKCLIDGLVQPVFIQRRKKIESRVVYARREYPEIFNIQ
ncbi:hypothetical protein NEAUS04_0196 [Nematocida ausubeli]|uniref:Uncharacterized protein n=1 Tax=Nematocida ausubeli (strain ATCC PRA-371 / ERTm2) TaxID=1913371 RepID=A0A086IYY5_NEMA1|nr:uncharacterized protein NESG_02425 [Nematocida ausubeli]KAI5160863.1 hypothetical protein NEAUS04_0196 [Nematocida ausubeli]KFG25103.1 hypothetical protein NESG_02425 [Nematocida ausubeli]